MEEFRGVENYPDCASRITVRKDPRHGLIDRSSRGRNDENEYPAPPLFAPQSSPQMKKPTVAGKLPIPLKSNAFIQNMRTTCKVSSTISAAPQGHQSLGAADATQLIIRNGELQMRNNELDGIVRRYETDVSQLRTEINRLKQTLRERESSSTDKQAEIDRANMRAAVAETASTAASTRAIKAGEKVAALTTEVHHAQCEIVSLKSQLNVAQTAEADARNEALNSRAEAESSRREAANSEALVTGLSKELAEVRVENTHSQEGLERIQRKLASLRALIKAPDLVTGRGRKRNRAVSSRLSCSEEGTSETATEQQEPGPHDGTVDDRRAEIVVGLCDLFSTVTMNDVEFHDLERVLLVTPNDGHDKGTQVDTPDAAETTDEWARPPGEVTPPKQPGPLVSDSVARSNGALSRSSPLPEELTQSRRISSRREALNARVAQKEAEARRIEEEREKERAQRIRDARLAREAQRETQCSQAPGGDGTSTEGGPRRCSQVESKKRPRTQQQPQARRAKQGEKHLTLVDPQKSRPQSLEDDQAQVGSGYDVSTGPSSVHGSPVSSVVTPERGLTSGHEIVDFLPASSEEGVLASDNGNDGETCGGTREGTETSASGNSGEAVDSSASTELPALAPLAEFVIGDKSLTDDFVGDSVTRRSRRKGEGGPRSARRRSLRLQKILAQREGDADNPPAAASDTQPPRQAGRPGPREKKSTSCEPDAEDSNSLVTVSASDRVADGGAKHTLECSDRAETPAQARRCRAEEIVPFGEEEVGGVSVKETEDMAREWFAEAATPESVLIGVCAVARVLASRYLTDNEMGAETSWDAPDGAMRCLRTLLVETIRAEAGAIRHGSKPACEATPLPPATSKCGTMTSSKAMVTQAQGGGKKRLRFRNFDLSSVDMPSDSKDAAKQPSEVPSDAPAREVVRYLERAVGQSDLLRQCLRGLGPEEGVVKRVEALLRGLRTIMISEHASSLIDKTRAVCASLGSSGVSAKDITGAAGLLLDELQPLREVSEGPLRTPLRSLLADFLSSLIRSKLRRLLNPPPTPLTKLACLERAAPEPTNHGTVHKLVQLMPDTRGGVSKDVAAKDGATSAVLTTAMLKLYGYSTCGADEAMAAAESFASDHESYWDARSLTAASDDVAMEALLSRARRHQGDAIEVLAATRAREFVISLLDYPGVEEAIALAGGWDDIQNLAASLNTVSHSPNARAHLTLFSDMRKLREWLGCQRSWVHEERATAVLYRLDRFIAKCVDKQCTGKHPNDARRTREEARYLRQVAMWEMSFATVAPFQQVQNA